MPKIGMSPMPVASSVMRMVNSAGPTTASAAICAMAPATRRGDATRGRADVVGDGAAGAAAVVMPSTVGRGIRPRLGGSRTVLVGLSPGPREVLQLRTRRGLGGEADAGIHLRVHDVRDAGDGLVIGRRPDPERRERRLDLGQPLAAVGEVR